MWRILSLPLLMLLTASAPTMSAPNAEELSRALASSNDWRAILIVAVVLMGMLFGLAFYAIWQMGRAQTSAAVVAEKFTAAADKLAEATRDSDTQIAVQLALIQSNQVDIKSALAGRPQ